MTRRALARAALALASLAALAACAKPRPPIELAPGRSLFWEVRGGAGDATFYLLGSVHVGDGRPLALAPTLEAAFARSEELVATSWVSAGSRLCWRGRGIA